jgi:beta-lactamase superfamily II metal-dependent hydrolase
MLAKTWTLVIVVAVLVGTGLPRVELAAQAANSRAERLRRETDNVALQNLAPFKVFDNLYYVGVGYVGSWLITTNQGLVLIDTLEGAYKEHPLEGIRKLGFDPANIKYVILTHYHLDHTAGAARIQELPGVRMAMGEADWDALTRAPNPNHERLPRRDIAVKDGDTSPSGRRRSNCVCWAATRRRRSASISRCTTAESRIVRSCSAGPRPVRGAKPPNSLSRA